MIYVSIKKKRVYVRIVRILRLKEKVIFSGNNEEGPNL